MQLLSGLVLSLPDAYVLGMALIVTKRAKDSAMKSKLFFNAFLLFLVVAVVGCSRMEAQRHELSMKGQILDVIGNSAYLCIGSKDGAEVGDQFMVYRFSRAMNPNAEYAEQPYYKREVAGRIKIIEIIDEHMAKARILEGEVKPHYFAELEG
jgi:hypothetical protein